MPFWKLWCCKLEPFVWHIQNGNSCKKSISSGRSMLKKMFVPFRDIEDIFLPDKTHSLYFLRIVRFFLILFYPFTKRYKEEEENFFCLWFPFLSFLDAVIVFLISWSQYQKFDKLWETLFLHSAKFSLILWPMEGKCLNIHITKKKSLLRS